MHKSIILLIIAILISGCNNQITGNTIKPIYRETKKPISLFFCPENNCTKELVNFINSSEKYVHCALFDLKLKEVLNILAEKSKNTDVKLVIDNNNHKNQAKGNIVIDNSNQLTHNKFCIIDGKKISTGSFNPTIRGAYRNNNNLLIINSEYLAINYEEEFNELWNKEFGKGKKVKYPIIHLNEKKIENYFCPEDNCKEHTIETINKAKESIYFMTFSFTDEEIADAILFKHIKIKGVFEKTQAASQYSQYKRLKDFGLNVKIDNNSYNMHHKVFIIDEKTVITGSYNPTGAGSYKNDENMLIIHDKDIAARYVSEFNSLWID